MLLLLLCAYVVTLDVILAGITCRGADKKGKCCFLSQAAKRAALRVDLHRTVSWQQLACDACFNSCSYSSNTLCIPSVRPVVSKFFDTLFFNNQKNPVTAARHCRYLISVSLRNEAPHATRSKQARARRTYSFCRAVSFLCCLLPAPPALLLQLPAVPFPFYLQTKTRWSQHSALCSICTTHTWSWRPQRDNNNNNNNSSSF